jgi:hypothetical protein
VIRGVLVDTGLSNHSIGFHVAQETLLGRLVPELVFCQGSTHLSRQDQCWSSGPIQQQRSWHRLPRTTAQRDVSQHRFEQQQAGGAKEEISPRLVFEISCNPTAWKQYTVLLIRWTVSPGASIVTLSLRLSSRSRRRVESSCVLSDADLRKTSIWSARTTAFDSMLKLVGCDRRLAVWRCRVWLVDSGCFGEGKFEAR